MQENNFEKQMQQEMQEFRITPSDNLWQQVKADLDAKRKSKRRWWFAAMIFCACLMLPSLLLNDPEIRNETIKTELAVENKNDKTTSVPDITTIEKEKAPIAEKKIIPLRKDQLNNQNVNTIATAKQQTVINTVAKNSKQAIVNKHAKVSVSAGEIAEEDQWNTVALLSPHEPVKLDAAGPELIALETGSRKSVTLIQPIKLSMLEPVYRNSAGIRANKTTLKTRWGIELAASAGRFSVSDNSLFAAVFNSNPNKALDMESTNLNGGVGVADSVIYAQSYLKHGNAFSIALNFTKPVTKKTSISLGAGFRYGNTRLVSKSYLAYASPGNYTSSRPTGTVNTANHFYFIDLPVQIQSLIGSGKKIPVYWNAGLMYSYLIRSSTLQFNAIQNNYTSSTLTKNLLGISAGLDVELLKNKKAAFKIGPSFYYSFSKAAEKDLYKNMHYHFAGIRIKKSL